MNKEKIFLVSLIFFVLFLVVGAITLLNTPLSKEDSCLKAGYKWDKNLEKCIKKGKPVYCSQVLAENCKEIYQPVCGWYNTNNIRCLSYPCAKTFSNDCFACLNENVLYFTQGVCPV